MAAIIYRYRQHIINVFVWPVSSRADRSIRSSTYRGYSVAKFESESMSCWAISDLNTDELGKLADLLQPPLR